MTEGESSLFFKKSVGTILIAIGCCIEFEVLARLKTLFDAPDTFKAFLSLIPDDVAQRTLQINDQTIVLPIEGIHFIAYFIALSILVISALVGGTFLKRGLGIL